MSTQNAEKMHEVHRTAVRRITNHQRGFHTLKTDLLSAEMLKDVRVQHIEIFHLDIMITAFKEHDLADMHMGMPVKVSGEEVNAMEDQNKH